MSHFELEQHYQTRKQQLEYAAERSQLVHDATYNPRHSEREAVFAPALAHIGDWLVKVGNRLQCRYGHAMELPEAMPAPGDLLPQRH